MVLVHTFSIAMAFLAAPAFAHDGHGLSLGHGHASDVFGFIAGLAILGAVGWWRGRK